MKKAFLFFWLYLLYPLFISPVLAEMSNQEKREFIESLAEPIGEKRVFFRWQDRKNVKKRKITGEFAKHFESNWGAAGSGIYVAKDLFSSSDFGDHLVQVEVEPNYKFLDLNSPKVQEKINQKGITLNDIYNKLEPKVMLRDTVSSTWYVLKDNKGVNLKPFSPRELSLDTLEFVYMFKNGTPGGKTFDKISKEKRENIINFVKKEILRRAEKSPGILKGFIKYPAKKGVEFLSSAANFSPDVRVAIMDNILSHITTVKEGMFLLAEEGKVFSESEKSQIAKKVVKTTKELETFSEFLDKKSYKEIKKTIRAARLNCLKKQLLSLMPSSLKRGSR